MRRLAALAIALSALPFAPAGASGVTTTAWVVERTSPTARTLAISGGAGAQNGEYAFAAIATATSLPDGGLASARGELFFGLTMDMDVVARTPAGTTRCSELPDAGTACAGLLGAGGLGYVVWWDDATFDRAFVVMRGRDLDVDLLEPGWTLRPWRGPVRLADQADVVSAGTAVGRGAAAYASAATSLPGGPRGSLAIGELPCSVLSLPGAGAGAALLRGGTSDVVTTCADYAPPAAVANGATTWTLTGAAAGVSEGDARLVVVEAEPPAETG